MCVIRGCFRSASGKGTQYIEFKLREVEESGLPRCIWNAEHVGSNPTFPTRLSRSCENDVAGVM